MRISSFATSHKLAVQRVRTVLECIRLVQHALPN